MYYKQRENRVRNHYFLLLTGYSRISSAKIQASVAEGSGAGCEGDRGGEGFYGFGYFAVFKKPKP